MATSYRTYVAGKYALELDGLSAGWLMSVEGGDTSSEVVVEKIGADLLQRGVINHEEGIAITCGTGMLEGFYAKINGFLQGTAGPLSGVIHRAGDELRFTKALITELGMPALDAASKAACTMSIKLSPATIASKPHEGPDAAKDAVQAPPWRACDFRLSLHGLDLKADAITGVDALTVRRPARAGAYASPLKASHLAFTLPEDAAGSLVKAAPGTAMSGALEYLDPTRKAAYFTLEFSGHLVSVTPDKVEAGGEQLRRVKPEMYVEKLTFKLNTSAWQ